MTAAETPHWVDDRPGIVCLFLAALLLLAALEMPYGYYQFLRLAVSVGAAYVAIALNKENRTLWMLFAIGAVLLFNPLIPVELDREEWLPLDIGLGIAFGALGLSRIAAEHRRSEVMKKAGWASAIAVGLIALVAFDPPRNSDYEANTVMVDMDVSDTMLDGGGYDQFMLPPTPSPPPAIIDTANLMADFPMPEPEPSAADPALDEAADAIDAAADAVENAANIVEAEPTSDNSTK